MSDRNPSPLREYLERPLSAPNPNVLAAIDAGPIAPRDALPIAAIDRLLDPAPLHAETGWCWTADGVAYVAVRTEAPRTTGAMWDWWFAWHPGDPLRYRAWYPDRHFDISFRAPARPAAKPHWGATHYPVEDVGLGRQTVRIEFLPPSSYGFASDALSDPRVATIVGGFVGSPRAHARVGVVCHAFLRDGDGVVLRSRFWLGGLLRPDLPGRLGDAVGRLVNRPAVRRRVLPAGLPRQLARHCAIEFANLASILPDLHARFARDDGPPSEGLRPGAGRTDVLGSCAP